MQIKVVQASSPKANNVQVLYKPQLDVEDFISRANNAAVSLYTITHLCATLFGGTRIQRDIANKLVAVAGALSSLRRFLDESLVSAAHVKVLAEQIESCRPVLAKINMSVQTLHDHADLTSGNTRFPGYFNAFMKGEDVEPQRILDECFHAILRVRFTLRPRGNML
jgi:hypothetical protein